MVVYDCFTFFNETEILKLRLITLNDVVDKFVLVESSVSYANTPKPFNFEALSKEDPFFIPYLSKIQYIRLENNPSDADCWKRENHQRNCIMYGLESAGPDDTVMMSDLDEIPNPHVVSMYVVENVQDTYVCEQDFYYYTLENKLVMPWYGTIIARFKNLSNPLQVLRDSKDSLLKIENGGWHFSFFGGKDRVATKIQNFAHQELNLSPFTDTEQIQRRIDTGTDPFDRTHMQIQRVPLAENSHNLPEHYQLLL